MLLELRRLEIPPGQRLLLRDVTWQEFETILEELGDHLVLITKRLGMSIEQAVIDKLRVLPLDKQQEVLDFVEFLEDKTRQQELNSRSWAGMTALEASQSVMGAVGDGPTDLSTNPKYMDGFGQ